MDRRSISIIAVSVALLLSWQFAVNHFFPPPPAPPFVPTTNGAPASVKGGTNGATNTAVTGATLSTPGEHVAVPLKMTGPEQTEVIETDDAIYTFTSHGGGLKLVEVKHYPRFVSNLKSRKDTNRLAAINIKAPLPVLAVTGNADIQGDGVFTLTKSGPRTLRAEKLLTNGLVMVKEFTIGTNYLLKGTVRVENRLQEAVVVPQHEVIIGTATPVNQNDDPTLIGMFWYNGNKLQHILDVWFANPTLGCFPGKPRPLYTGGERDVEWAAVHNQFFALITMPKEKAPAVSLRKLGLPHPTEEERAEATKNVVLTNGYEAAFRYAGTVLAPGAALEHHYDFFAGPKEYRTLSRLASQLKNNIDAVMDFGGITGPFAKALLLFMNGLHSLFSSKLGYGWIIIIMTVIIKLVFWPLTQASTRMMKRMAELQPKMKELQDKYKSDPVKLQQKLGEFYKEHKINPVAGCLPMLVQMPVFIGMIFMVRTAIELRGAQFLWAPDLSAPDTVFIIPGLGFIPFLSIPGVGFPINPLALLMGATMIWQARMTPMSPGMDPMQQKMMKYMPLIFVLMLYNYSAGLTLYWTVQNILSIAQMKLMQKNEPPKNAAVAATAASAKPAPKKAR